jgi:hypothetical protein
VRIATFVVVVAVILATTTAYFVRSRAQEGHGGRGAEAERVPLARVESVPRIVFRNTSPGADFGHVALVPRNDPRGPRAITALVCDRVAATAQEMACLRAGTGIASSYRAMVVRAGHVLRTDDRPGIPSRARLSPGGTLIATTAFVAGDSYTSAQFSTRTFITPVAGGHAMHVEDFQLVAHGDKIAPVDRNYWGVTFLDEDAFYVTVSFSGHTWLARGSVTDHTVTTVRETAECPSVSPDHTQVAYKKRQSDGTWRIAVLDLATGREHVLPGGRSVDDQVTWLGDDTLLYALPRTGAQSGQSDVWAVAAHGTSAPRLLIREASSPTVVG